MGRLKVSLKAGKNLWQLSKRLKQDRVPRVVHVRESLIGGWGKFNLKAIAIPCLPSWPCWDRPWMLSWASPPNVLPSRFSNHTPNRSQGWTLHIGYLIWPSRQPIIQYGTWFCRYLLPFYRLPFYFVNVFNIVQIRVWDSEAMRPKQAQKATWGRAEPSIEGPRLKPIPFGASLLTDCSECSRGVTSVSSEHSLSQWDNLNFRVLTSLSQLCSLSNSRLYIRSARKPTPLRPQRPYNSRWFTAKRASLA